MKTLWTVVTAAALVAAVFLQAQVFVPGSSTWDSGRTFVGTGAGGQTLTAGPEVGAFYGASQPDANTYVFGFVNTNSGTGSGGIFQTSDYNLASTVLTAGTALDLVFTGLSAAPRYIAYTGGALSGYNFNAGTGTLTLSASTQNPVASASDPTGATLASAFGLMLVTGGAHDFGSSVFRSDMFWDDITPLAGYTGTNFVAGLNAAGQDGATATFYAYLPMAFLGAQGISSPADCEARLQKDGVGSAVISGITREVFTPSNPGFANEGSIWSYGGASAFDFDGTVGADNYVLASYSNSSWSNGDIGIAAVPEPATSALALGILVLLGALHRRSRR